MSTHTKQQAFTAAKEKQAILELARDKANEELKAASGEEKGSMGLTPDHVKETQAWQKARQKRDAADARLRAFNRPFVKEFKKEIAADRKARKGY